MTVADIAAHVLAMDDLRDSWVRKVNPVIVAAIDRAHAHSVVALTETLRATPDGRKSLRRASQSRSYLSALSDLDNLTTALVGPSVASLDGLLRDAREAAYRTSLASWVDKFPEQFSVGVVEPSRARIADVRGLVLHGMELRREIGAKVDQVKRSLLANLEMSARRADPRSSDRLSGWKIATTSEIARSALIAIGDAFTAIDGLAGVDAVRPEFRPKNQYTPT